MRDWDINDNASEWAKPEKEIMHRALKCDAPLAVRWREDGDQKNPQFKRMIDTRNMSLCSFAQAWQIVAKFEKLKKEIKMKTIDDFKNGDTVTMTTNNHVFAGVIDNIHINKISAEKGGKVEQCAFHITGNKGKIYFFEHVDKSVFVFS